MNEIKDTVTRILAGLTTLIGTLVLILGFKNAYESFTNPKYNKAICEINNEIVEFKINKIKKLENGEYLFTDDKDNQWQLSSRICTFVEE